MRVLGLALAAALVLAALLVGSCSREVSAARVPASSLAVDQTSNSRRGAAFSSPADDVQPRKPAASDNAAASGSSARLDASSWKKAAAAAAGGGSSPPSATVFDPDRMSKRRVRRGSDPIHNKC